jgi:hypothetical protein
MLVAQSVPICLALSVMGGAVEVLATAVLAFQDADERQKGKNWSLFARRAALAMNVILQLISSLVGNLFATWFGPVSLVGPTFLCSQLVANMFVFGYLLGLESFTKDMRIGTYVVVLAVVLLPTVGPAAQEDQDIMSLVDQWYNLAWGALLVFGMAISTALLLLLDVLKMAEWRRMALLLSARATAFSVNLTFSKVMVLDVTLPILALSIFLKVSSGAIITYALVVQSTAVTQAKFVPLNASALIVVNALTGIIVWEDWRVVGSWIGYVCVFLYLVLGCYLLLGDIELLSQENSKYGRKSVLGSMRPLVRLPLVGTLETVQEAEEEQPQPVSMEQLSISFQKWTDGPVPGEGPGRRRSRRESWATVYEIDNTLHADGRGAYRRRSIFGTDADVLT